MCIYPVHYSLKLCSMVISHALDCVAQQLLPEEFWGRLARSRLEWQKEFKTVTDHDRHHYHFRWFPDGQLNASVNCVDRHARRHPDRVALLWEKDEPGQEERITYRELQDLVCKMGNVLKDSGVRRGDRVALYLPVSPLAVAAMLACARIGAVHSVVFAGFSAEALASRIQDAGVETVITADQAVRGGKLIQLKQVVDAAVEKCPSIKRVLVGTRTGAQVKMGPKDIALSQALSSASTECPPAVQNAEDLLFLLYTSGSTGSPKGVGHSTAGYLLYAATTHKHVFDYREGDVFGCVADIGWITGHSYVVYGPLANGATTLLFESTPSYPNPGRYWEMVERLRLTHFYCAPTALRLLLRYEDDFVLRHDRSSLRVLGCVGEPLNHEAWHWFNDMVGEKRCVLTDTWWQTETGGIMISPRPSAPDAPVYPGMPMRPMFGVNPVLCDPNGKVVEGLGVDGALCVNSVWPGISRTVYGDHKRYVDTYFSPYPGYYFSGDGGLRDKDGYYHITGRMDDVINVTGHRLGTAEVEDAMMEHPEVAETAVVGFPHDIKGEGVFAFIVLKKDLHSTQEEIISDLKKLVRTQIAGYAVPEVTLVCPGLPKTRSGKIMRRILRKVAANKPEELGDISTLADPSVVKAIVDIFNAHRTH
ncbi:acetyl-coenzyme A synthetase 2-like, mitochondrial isoform X2 [Homarus americanus]|uniref:acetyl-coenzyme A synthetase 2-like, mitochondrial isoform X2 n=1 Tax=Homarus americanus TaxID=6706 RepID=UPI001C478402|nr:acetyl-coenzyme A synthetase 2-like, mitochondrial isoform X2 [Homarus americanus]